MKSRQCHTGNKFVNVSFSQIAVLSTPQLSLARCSTDPVSSRGNNHVINSSLCLLFVYPPLFQLNLNAEELFQLCFYVLLCACITDTCCDGGSGALCQISAHAVGQIRNRLRKFDGICALALLPQTAHVNAYMWDSQPIMNKKCTCACVHVCNSILFF